MVESRRSATAAASPGGGGGKDGRGSGKRPSAPPRTSPSPSKRGKDDADSKASGPKGNATAGESSRLAATGKPLLQKRKRACAVMLSQHPQIPHVPFSDEISVSRGDNYHIGLDEQAVSRDQFLLHHLEQGNPCEAAVYASRGNAVLGFERNQISKVTNDVELRPDSCCGEQVVCNALGKLFEVISEESKSSKLIVLIKDTEMLFTEYTEWLRRELPLSVLIVVSQTHAHKEQKASGGKAETSRRGAEHLNSSVLNKICIKLAQNEPDLSCLKRELEDDTEMLKAKDKVDHIDEDSSAERIRETQAVFPAAPDSKILGHRNQYLDLWSCGRAIDDPWAETWRRRPLVFHDADVVEAVIINLAEDDGGRRDETDTISIVLEKHPGPVQCLHLDRTACPGPGLLREWVDTLSGKEVRELVLVNLTRPTEDIEFPLDRLRSRSLRTLALGFFGLSALGLHCSGNLATVRDLNLAGCRFSGEALSMVILFMPELSSLTVGSCDVTAGCGRQGLIIESGSLTKLLMWKCTASAVTIVEAPALHDITTGIVPRDNPATARPAVSIDLSSAQALRTLQHLDIHRHQLKLKEQLPCLETLVVGIKLCMCRDASILLDLLGGLPRLVKLTLWRVDDLPPGGDDEGCRKAWSFASTVPPCIAYSLKFLLMQDYRGGAGEVALVARVLSTAHRLLKVTLRLHPTRPLVDATAPFQTCSRASKDATILVEPAA